jgi:hypothetical protein
LGVSLDRPAYDIFIADLGTLISHVATNLIISSCLQGSQRDRLAGFGGHGLSHDKSIDSVMV